MKHTRETGIFLIFKMNKNISQLSELAWGEKRNLYDELVRINRTIPDIIQDILTDINSYDASILTFSEDQTLKPKLTTYLLHYIIPFYELLQKNEQKNISKLLATQLLSFIAWRTFDNCVDEHESSKTAHLSSLATCMQLIGFVQQSFPAKKVEDIYMHYRTMAEQSFQETEKPVELEDIWKRCSIIFYAVETLSDLDKKSVLLFKQYINYTGLAHDMADFLSDVSNQIVSLPVYWFREGNDYEIINVETVKQIYLKARIAIKPIEDKFNSLNLKGNFPLINYLLLQANSLFHENILEN